MDAPSTDRSALRRISVLLGVIAGLLAVLLVMGVLGAVWAARTVATLAPATSMQGVEAELARRQAVLDRELEGVASRSLQDVEGYRARRMALEDVSGGPLKKMDTVVRLNQLMSEEMMTLITNSSGAERALAHATRPLPTEQQAEPSQARRGHRER